MPILSRLFFILSIPQLAWAGCEQHLSDSFDQYNAQVKSNQVNNIPTEYYVLSYSWSPDFCERFESSLVPQRNALQCEEPSRFGYILHGLWPQGQLNGQGGYPRACEGDQPKISSNILDNYLCMTPSRSLLQHEFEYHGTCMHDEKLETPERYFQLAFALHKSMRLPTDKLQYSESNVQWWLDHNPHLVAGSVKYWHKGNEWQFCLDTDFNSMACPSHQSEPTVFASTPISDCPIKGNISKRSGKRWFFTPEHRNYQSVVIDKSKGDKCFENIKRALAAGWKRAPQ